MTWMMAAEFIASATTFSVVMTWVFNRTGESLPLAMLLHVSVNTFFSVAWAQMFPTMTDPESSTHVQLLASTTVAIILLIATRGRLGYRPAVEHPTPASRVN